MRRWPSTRGTDGQALIEFAFVAPLLLVMLLAIFDVSSAMNFGNEETNLANLAARISVVAAGSPPGCSLPGGASYETTNDNVYGYVQCEAYSDSATLAGAIGVCVNDENLSSTELVSGDTVSQGDALKITVEYPYNFLKFVSPWVNKVHVTLASSATMMVEADPMSATFTQWLYEANSDGNNSANANSELTKCHAIS